MDRCPQHSTIRANSCFRPVPTSALHLRLQPPRASLEKRQSNSAQVVCLWHRLFRVTVNNGLRNRSPGRESCSAGANGRIASAATACRPGYVVAMAVVIGVLISLGALGPGNGLGSILWNCVIAALQNLA